MVENAVPAGSYTFDASANTITLTGDFASVTAERVKSIKNLTKTATLYDSEQLYNGSITITDSVISGIKNVDGAADANKIQIIVDSVMSISSTPVAQPLDTLLDNVTLTALASSTPSEALMIYEANSVSLIMKKTGDSTSISFVVYSSPDGTNIDTEAYQTFSILGAGTRQLSRPLSSGVGYIVVKGVNNDTVNSGAVTAQVLQIC